MPAKYIEDEPDAIDVSFKVPDGISSAGDWLKAAEQWFLKDVIPHRPEFHGSQLVRVSADADFRLVEACYICAGIKLAMALEAELAPSQQGGNFPCRDARAKFCQDQSKTLLSQYEVWLAAQEKEAGHG